MTKTTIVDVIMMVGIVVVLKSIRVTAKNVNASNEKLANNMSIFFGHQVLFSLQMSLYQKHTPFYFQSILVLVSTIFFAIFEINTPALPPSCFQSEVCMFLKYQCSMYTNSGYWISLNFNSPFLAESESQNSNVGGKQLENPCWFPNKYDFRLLPALIKSSSSIFWGIWSWASVHTSVYYALFYNAVQFFSKCNTLIK